MSINTTLLEVLNEHIDNAFYASEAYRAIIDRYPQVNHATKLCRMQKTSLIFPAGGTQRILRSYWDDKPGIRAALWRKLGRLLRIKSVSQRGMILRREFVNVMRNETVTLDHHLGMFTSKDGPYKRVYRLDLGYSPASDLLCYRWYVIEQEAIEHED